LHSAATPRISTLSLHDALPIFVRTLREDVGENGRVEAQPGLAALDTLVAQHRLAGLIVRIDRNGHPRALPTTTDQAAYRILQERSEEHTSELQSRSELVCRLLL